MKDKVRTMAEIARLAGVSVSTVSRSLSGHVGIPDETRRRILGLAEKHGYRVNERARNFRLGRSNTVAAALPQSVVHRRGMSDPFYLELLSGILDELTHNGFDLLIVQPAAEPRALANYVREKRADGLLLLGRADEGIAIADLERADVPFVAWGPTLPMQKYVSVGGDSIRGAELAAEHLLACGRRRLAFVGGDQESLETKQRLRGFKQLLQKTQGALSNRRIRFTDYTPHGAKLAVSDLLNEDPTIDAIFFCSDYMALAGIELVQNSGRSVPDDVAIVGYDDIPLASYANPRLTTVRQEIYAGGRLMSRLLLQLIEGEAADPMKLPVHLVVRDTTGPAPPA